jgi:polyhydroxybutyrate depolymerase
LLALIGACGESADDGDGDPGVIDSGVQLGVPEASAPVPDAGNAPPPLPSDSGATTPIVPVMPVRDGGTPDGASAPDSGSVSGDAGTATGGDTPAPGTKSAGCGKTGSPPSGMYNLDVGGTQRMYIIKLPSSYDANKAYKLVFTWHYLGGSASGIARNYYGLEAMSQGSAIFVSPEGIDAGWSNSGGRDVAFAKAMVDKFKADYCIDEGRVFSTGFSYGGIMSNTVGCAMGDVFRAIAPMAGSGPRGGRCVGKVAAWITHGSADTTVSFSSGQASRDHWRMSNGCGMETEAADANGCVSYKGCAAGFPVVWCQTTAGHTQPRFAPQATWAFFSQF